MTAHSALPSCFVRFALVLGVMGAFCGRAEAAEPEVLVAFYEVTGDSEWLTESFAQASSRSDSRSGGGSSALKGIRKLFSSKKKNSKHRAEADASQELAVVGVFTDPQAKMLIRTLLQKKLNVVSLPSAMIPSGKTELVNDGAARFACTATASHAGDTIKLEVFLSREDAEDDIRDGQKPSLSIAIFNDSHVLCKLPPWPGQDEDQLVFIHAQVLEEDS